MTRRFIKRGVHSGKETCEKMRHYINVHHPCHTPLMEACLLTPHSYTNECRCHTYEWVSTNTPDSYVWHDSSIRVTCDSSCASVMKCTVISWVSFFLSFFLSLAFFFLFSWMLKTWLNYLVIPRQVTLAQLLAVVSAPKGKNSPQCF